jgi:hypothetical protein
MKIISKTFQSQAVLVTAGLKIKNRDVEDPPLQSHELKDSDVEVV